jgi:ATP-dependent DNA ligase
MSITDTDISDMDMWRIICDIQSEGARNVKQELLNKVVSSDMGSWIIRECYDPFRTWGVKPPPLFQIAPSGVEAPLCKEIGSRLLGSLAERRLTGAAAQKQVLAYLSDLRVEGRNIFWRILMKDMKIGMGVSSINDVHPNLIPSFAVQRAQTYADKLVKSWPVKAEFKLDGQRNAFVCRGSSGAYFTRSGKQVMALDFLVGPTLRVAGVAARNGLGDTLTDSEGNLSFMLDGEAMMGLFSETGKLRSSGDAHNVEYHLYDILRFDHFDAPGVAGPPLSERREVLSKFVQIAKKELKDFEHKDTFQIVPQYFANTPEEVMSLYYMATNKTLASYLARGDKSRESDLLKTTIDKATGEPKTLEGLMVKSIDAGYEKRKGRSWLKIKGKETADIPVVGMFTGNVATRHEGKFGGFLADYNGVIVRIAIGFSDALRERIFTGIMSDLEHASLKEKKTLFEDTFTSDRYAELQLESVPTDATMLMLGRLIEVDFHEVTPDGSMRHNRFIRFRDDKAGEIEK